jgi:hypothetical protein
MKLVILAKLGSGKGSPRLAGRVPLGDLASDGDLIAADLRVILDGGLE